MPLWLKVVLGLWALAWLGGAAGFFYGAKSFDREAAERSQPLTGLVENGEARFEAVIDGSRLVRAPFTERSCAATVVSLGARSWEKKTQPDKNGDTNHFELQIAERRTPDTVDVRVGDTRVVMPVALWQPPQNLAADHREQLQKIPDDFAVPPADIANAIAHVRGSFSGFYADEWCLAGGQSVFISAQMQTRAGVRYLLPKAGSTYVDLFKGTHAEASADSRGTAFGLRIAGGIFIALATLPLVIALVVTLRRRSR